MSGPNLTPNIIEYVANATIILPTVRASKKRLRI